MENKHKEKVDLAVRNVLIFNSYYKKFVHADVSVLDGRILFVDETREGACEANETVDGTGLWMAPGLIDIHMHIESSMITPRAFCDRAVECGITTIVSEPHEMANVAGPDGVLAMINAAEGCAIDVFYGIPSSVPSSSLALETTGGVIRCEDMERLKENPAVACVGEVMNYRQIIDNEKRERLEIYKFLRKLRERDRIFPIEGHCPSLLGLDLAKFLYLGINADHTEHSMEELRQQFAGGMFVEIQAKMLKKEVLDFIAENGLFEHFCFVTDDVMADTLATEGHLDAIVRRAIGLGMKPEQALYNATFTPARRMNLLDRGTLAPGRLADFVLLDNLENFSVASTWKKGKPVFARGGKKVSTANGGADFPESYRHSIKLAPQTAASLRIQVDTKADAAQARVMMMADGSTKIGGQIVTLPVRDGLLQWENSGYLLCAVYERYGKNGNVGLGLLGGACHKRGAVATSNAHDCHNVLVAGANVEDMLIALNRVIELQGGIVVADAGRLQAELRLEIGGILSGGSVEEAGKQLGEVRAAMLRQGYKHYNPIMSFCTTTLPVSPSLRLTDKGLIDVVNSRTVPLIVE